MHEFLREIPLLANLSKDDFERVFEIVEEVRLPAGEELFAEGARGNRAYFIHEGQLEVVKTHSGRDVLLAVRGPGEVIGETSLLEDAPRSASVRAKTDAVLIAIPKEPFDDLLNTRPSVTRAMLHTVLDRWRETEVTLRQSEKMAQLGTLSAGVAHELNNPAAAVTRSAQQLSEALAQYEQAVSNLYRLQFTDDQQAAVDDLARQAAERAFRPLELDGLTRSDRTQELSDQLLELGVEDGWRFASALVDLGFEVDGLASLTGRFAAYQLPVVVSWLSASYDKTRLLSEIGLGAGQISEIVKALKTYSYLDQGPVQNVDVHEGLDATLVILRHKLKAGIIVRRDYAPDLPTIQAHGSELNQVWTNIIDNAADALAGHGEITIRTRRDGPWIVVEIQDDGPGIPEDIQPRIFDAFFTTKPPGQGTGLGLEIAYKIVVLKHHGDVTFSSQPGETRFEVRLPVEPRAS